MNKERPPKILDLPTEHVSGGAPDYIPAKTRDTAERDRLHELPAGTLLLEDQLKGIDVIKAVMTQLESPADLAYASDMFASSFINSSWYQYGRDFQGMRRHLELETMLDENGNYLSDEALIAKIVSRLEEIQTLAGLVTREHVERKDRYTSHAKLGRAMGNIASSLTSIGMGPIREGIELYDVKMNVRNKAQRAVRLSRADSLTHGARPSVAQFAKRDSDSLVAWRRDASDSAYQAMEAAYASIEN